jgi:hypothetical protein
MQTSLRIKKIYLRKILNGDKTKEFRKDSLFYRRLFSKKITRIMLHYQQVERLVVEVKRIRLVNRPKRFINDEMLPTKKIFVLTLGRIISHVD